MLELPDHLRDRMIATHGDLARAWLAELPHNLDALQRAWKFELGEPFANLSYAYVVRATLSDGTEAVLKAQPPHMESRSGLPALAAWDGNGAVRLLRHDTEGSFELLERAEPGVTLEDAALDDDEATRILVGSMPPLWIDPPGAPALISLERWGRSLAEYVDAYPGGDGPMPHDLVICARDTYAQMLATSPRPRLLHGDLHHGNLLSATRQPWLAIDPKGVVGDPAFEPSALFFNPHSRVAVEPDIPALVRRRHALICDVTGLDRHRVAAWGFARTVLSQCWSAGDLARMEPHMLAVAEALRQLM